MKSKTQKISLVILLCVCLFGGTSISAYAAAEVEVTCGTAGGADCNSSNGASGSTAGLTSTGDGDLSYTPLEPLSVDQSGTADLGSFLTSLFKILFSISGLIAVAMLAVGGIEYMVSDIAERKNEGLRRAQAAFYGLLILAGSWLLLNTINPCLLNFDLNIGSKRGAGCESIGASSQSASYDGSSITDLNNGTILGGGLSGSGSSGGGSSSGDSTSDGDTFTYQTYPAESSLAQAYASTLGYALHNTASGVALFIASRSALANDADTIAAQRTFTSECEAGGRGVTTDVAIADATKALYLCKSAAIN